MERVLELSDFASEKEEEIKKNPFAVLGVPEDASIGDVRTAYIKLSKRYHPDLLGASKRFEISGHRMDDISFISAIQEGELPGESEDTSSDFFYYSPGSKEMQEAHERMIEINRAYQEIKSRFNRRDWNQRLGYDFETVFDTHSHEFNKEVELEGDGKLIISPKKRKYDIGGITLCFDYQPDELWVIYGSDYDGYLNLRHLFAHIEREEGRPISRILLDPLFESFELDEVGSQKLLNLLSSKSESTESIMRKMGFEYGYGQPETGDIFSDSYRASFQRNLNEILYLKKPDFDYAISYEMKGDTFVLIREGESIFTEADYTLFLTLAYGPMLQAERRP